MKRLASFVLTVLAALVMVVCTYLTLRPSGLVRTVEYFGNLLSR